MHARDREKDKKIFQETEDTKQKMKISEIKSKEMIPLEIKNQLIYKLQE